MCIGQLTQNPAMPSVGAFGHPWPWNPSEEYELELHNYLEQLVLQYTEHIQWYEQGFFLTKNFRKEIVDDVYYNNLYYMSWFYDGLMQFDEWEQQFDSWLCKQVFLAMVDDEGH